jgi:hypothetical protein
MNFQEELIKEWLETFDGNMRDNLTFRDRKQ